MAEPSNPPDAVFKVFINADIQRVWRELTKTGEAQGADKGCTPKIPTKIENGRVLVNADVLMRV